MKTLYSLLLALCVATSAHAVGLEASQAVVSWNANTEADLAGYRLYTRPQPTGTRKFVIEMTKSATSTLLPALPAGQNYLNLTAFDLTGNESGESNQVPFVQLIAGMPMNLKAINITDGGAQLSFTQDSGKADVRLMPMPFSWGEAVSVPCVDRLCTVTGLLPDTAYGWAAVGYTGVMNQGAIYTPLTEMVTFRTLPVQPPPPPKKKCENLSDDDGDQLIDMADPGCTSPTDDDETNAPVPPPYTLKQAIQTAVTKCIAKSTCSGKDFSKFLDPELKKVTP